MNDAVALATGEATDRMLIGDWERAEEVMRRLPQDDLHVLYGTLMDLQSIIAHLIIERGGLPHPPKD